MCSSNTATLLTLALGLACWNHFWVVTTPESLLLTAGFGLTPSNRCLKGAITVIPIVGSSSLLLLLEEEDSLDSPKWLLFSSLIETEDGEIWQ